MRPWQADNTSGIVWTVGLEERCEVGVIVRRCCCSAHTGNEVSSCGWCGGTVVMELCGTLWFLLDCLWASGGQSTLD